MREVIRQQALQLGFDECRFTTADPPASGDSFQRWLAEGRHGEMGYLQRNAPKRVQPQLVLPGARSVVSLAVNYTADPAETPPPPGLPDPSHRQPNPTGVLARYARYQDYHDVLREPLTRLAALIDELGGPGSRSLWYVDTGPLLERDLAQRAGLGFVGKHTNVISRRLGNWIFLAEILTTVKLDSDSPERNHCGSCTRCLSACPTGAIRAPFQLDARLCISYLTIELKGPIPVELRPALGNRIYGCDDCLAVCPWNRFAKQGGLMKAHARTELGAPDLIELLHLDESGFQRRFAGTPMLRTRRRGLLRNVCVALGNVGDHRAVPALKAAAEDPEPLISEHAKWALAQIASRSGPQASLHSRR